MRKLLLAAITMPALMAGTASAQTVACNGRLAVGTVQQRDVTPPRGGTTAREFTVNLRNMSATPMLVFIRIGGLPSGPSPAREVEVAALSNTDAFLARLPTTTTVTPASLQGGLAFMCQ